MQGVLRGSVHSLSDSKCATLVINLGDAAHNAIFNEEGLHLSWFAQLISKM